MCNIIGVFAFMGLFLMVNDLIFFLSLHPSLFLRLHYLFVFLLLLLSLFQGGGVGVGSYFLFVCCLFLLFQKEKNHPSELF